MMATLEEAAQYALLCAYVLDTYDAEIVKTLTPPIDQRISDLGWNVIGYVCGTDVVFREKSKMELTGNSVFYGLVLQSQLDTSKYLSVFRGTDGLIEWIEDAKFELIRWQRAAGSTNTSVEDGFWGIYDSMRFVELDGTVINDPLYAVIQTKIASLQIPNSTLKCVGHSLGAPLAAYLTADIAMTLPVVSRSFISAAMFAMPHPGNKDFADVFDILVSDYEVYNYFFDFVTHVVPSSLGFSTLNRIIKVSSTDQVRIHMSVSCNHHALCYAAMLDYDAYKSQTMIPMDESCTVCIIAK